MAGVDDKLGLICSFEKFHGRPERGPVLPYMMPGRHKLKRGVKSKPKNEPCFYLSSGKDHASDFRKIILSPSATASYSADVTWGYRRAPFVGEWTTGSGGVAMTAPSPPAKGGGYQCPSPATGSAAALRGVVPAYAASGESPALLPRPLPPAPSLSQRQEAPVFCALPEVQPPALSVS